MKITTFFAAVEFSVYWKYFTSGHTGLAVVVSFLFLLEAGGAAVQSM